MKAEVQAEVGKIVERGSRKARVDRNNVPDEDPWAVFQHTYYMGRWYYDGYLTAETADEAVNLRNEWLNGSDETNQVRDHVVPAVEEVAGEDQAAP